MLHRLRSSVFISRSRDSLRTPPKDFAHLAPAPHRLRFGNPREPRSGLRFSRFGHLDSLPERTRSRLCPVREQRAHAGMARTQILVESLNRLLYYRILYWQSGTYALRPPATKPGSCRKSLRFLIGEILVRSKIYIINISLLDTYNMINLPWHPVCLVLW
jgi:hypothetical protein